MLSVGLQGLAGSSQFRCNLDTLSAELLLPGFQHSDVPFATLYAMYTVNKLSTPGKQRIFARGRLTRVDVMYTCLPRHVK